MDFWRVCQLQEAAQHYYAVAVKAEQSSLYKGVLFYKILSFRPTSRNPGLGYRYVYFKTKVVTPLDPGSSPG